MIWNRKRQNSLLILELLFAFLILFAVLSFVFYEIEKYRSPLGFDTEDIWIASFNFAEEADSAILHDTKAALKQSLASMPEIADVSFAFGVSPFSGSNWISSGADNTFKLESYMLYVDEDYQKAMGIKMIEGEWFNQTNTTGKYRPIIISKLLRDTYFPDSSMLGKMVVINGEKKIVGVAEHFKYQGEFEEEQAVSFNYLPQDDFLGLSMPIRVKPGTSPGFEETVNKTIRNIAKDWDFVIHHQETARERKSLQTWIPIFALLSICGFLVFNVALGLFGVLMYNIKKRRGEIGLRRAVGAPSSNIILQFLLEMLIITSIGLFIGLIFAIQLPIMKIFEVGNHIFIYGMLASIAIIFVLVTICTLYPSTQASQIHPALALHEE
ncbi:MAG: FtsX-like permease family protein [Bacteroidota bacterium]